MVHTHLSEITHQVVEKMYIIIRGKLRALGDIIFIWARRIKTRNLMVGIHASELKLWHFEVFHVCIGKPYMHICNDLHLY